MFLGAVVLAGTPKEVVFHEAYGQRDAGQPMTKDSFIGRREHHESVDDRYVTCDSKHAIADYCEPRPVSFSGRASRDKQKLLLASTDRRSSSTRAMVVSVGETPVSSPWGRFKALVQILERTENRFDATPCVPTLTLLCGAIPRRASSSSLNLLDKSLGPGV